MRKALKDAISYARSADRDDPAALLLEEMERAQEWAATCRRYSDRRMDKIHKLEAQLRECREAKS